MRISDWSADVCSSDLHGLSPRGAGNAGLAPFLKTAQSLLQEIRHLALPVPADLRPPGDGVEDEATTAPQAAKKLLEALWRLRLVLGVELIVAAQASELRAITPAPIVAAAVDRKSTRMNSSHSCASSMQSSA